MFHSGICSQCKKHSDKLDVCLCPDCITILEESWDDEDDFDEETVDEEMDYEQWRNEREQQ